MFESEAFTLVTSSSHQRAYDDYEDIKSAHGYDLNTSIQAALKRQYPKLNLTVVDANNVPLLPYAAMGNATSELDTKTESIERMRYFYNGSTRSGIPDQLGESRTFAKYNYKWVGEDFIVYLVFMGRFIGTYQYILKEPGEGETTDSHCAITDALIYAVGESFAIHDEHFVYVYDLNWSTNRALWTEVQKTEWKDVILNEQMKKAVTEVMTKFFDSKDIYDDLGVPWKRGVIFHGPAGNGKTLSIKALMHSLTTHYNSSIPALYVKSAPRTWDIRNVFSRARSLAPCMLILEDIDTIVTPQTRSYFFNEVDGLENNDGIFMVASTNHLDQLDPGLSSRPSRFDRKYLFPLPSEEERILYCEYWREKLKHKPAIKFPQKLSPAIAGITQGFSFAYLKEAFVATLLVIAAHRSEEMFPPATNTSATFTDNNDDNDDDDNDLDDFELWREMKKQVKLLRNEMSSQRTTSIHHNPPPTIQCHPDKPPPRPISHTFTPPGPNSISPYNMPNIRRANKSSSAFPSFSPPSPSSSFSSFSSPHNNAHQTPNIQNSPSSVVPIRSGASSSPPPFYVLPSFDDVLVPGMGFRDDGGAGDGAVGDGAVRDGVARDGAVGDGVGKGMSLFLDSGKVLDG